MSIHIFPLDSHLIIFRPEGRRLFILNQTASWIWQAVADGLQTDEIIEQLADHYQISRKETEHDVCHTLDQWASQNLDPTQAKTTAAVQTLPCNKKQTSHNTFPVDMPISLQHCFLFGTSSFSLVDYTPDLHTHFVPLFSNLPTIDQKDCENTIELIKEGDEYIIFANRMELERTPLELVAVGRVIQSMVELGYPTTTWMAFIHASAGALNGKGFVFPGIGGSGKSTLMAALAKSGWTYWCDDTTPLDTLGQAAAVPLNHCIKSGSWDILASYYPDLYSLPTYYRSHKDVRYLPAKSEQTYFSSTMPVHHLVFPVYLADCPQELQPLSPVEGLQFLVDAQSWISPDPDLAEKLIRWIKKTPAYRLNYHSLEWAIARLKLLANDHSAP